MSTRASVSKKTKRKRADQTGVLMRGVVKAMCSNTANRATRAIDLEYGRNAIVQVRKRIKYATSHMEKCLYVAVAIMLGYNVFVRRGKIMVEEKPEVQQSQSSRGGGGSKGKGITDKERAFLFYSMWRLRKEQNPFFDYMNKDVVLMICYFVMKDKVDVIMSQL